MHRTVNIVHDCLVILEGTEIDIPLILLNILAYLYNIITMFACCSTVEKDESISGSQSVLGYIWSRLKGDTLSNKFRIFISSHLAFTFPKASSRMASSLARVFARG